MDKWRKIQFHHLRKGFKYLGSYLTYDIFVNEPRDRVIVTDGEDITIEFKSVDEAEKYIRTFLY